MNLNRIILIGIVASAATWVTPAKANQTQNNQTSQAQGNNTYPAELSVPFGIVQGTLVTSSDNLIFIDSQQLGGSFAIPKSDIGQFRFDGDRISIELKNPIKDRAGDRTSLTFRLTGASQSEPLASWMRAEPELLARGGAERSAPDQATIYQVIHKHRIGECTGRLIISGDRMNFESVTDLNDSRQWSLRDIREVKRSNPYQLEVQPFVGNTYNFELLGQGMDSDVYKKIVDRIATLRTPPASK